MVIKKDIQDIIDYSHRFAKKLLIEFKEYYPFGVAIDSKDNLIPIVYKDSETDMPESQKLIDELFKLGLSELENHNIRAFGITYDVRVKNDNLENKSDAIIIDIIHFENKNLPRYYFTYSWTKENELVFGQSYGMDR